MAQAVLFACTMNAVRSPMAAAMLRHLTRDIHIESAGVRAGELDPLAVEAMDEIGLAIAKHQPRSQLSILNETGHHIFRERYDEFNRLVANFVEGVINGD